MAEKQTGQRPLFGRVMRVGKINHYGRATDGGDSFAYNFSIEIGMVDFTSPPRSHASREGIARSGGGIAWR